MIKSTTYKCPDCVSDQLVVRAITSYYLNSGEFFCHSVKTQDSDAEVACMACGWTGTRSDFSTEETQ